MYPYSSGPSKGAFSTRPCQNRLHPSHKSKQHANSNRHRRQEKKLSSNGISVYITGVKKLK